MIQKEAATVYRGGGRRWFTKWGAASAEAREKIKSKCDCDNGDSVTPPEICWYHADDERYAKIIRRLSRLHILRFKQDQATSEGQEG